MDGRSYSLVTQQIGQGCHHSWQVCRTVPTRTRWMSIHNLNTMLNVIKSQFGLSSGWFEFRLNWGQFGLRSGWTEVRMEWSQVVSGSASRVRMQFYSTILWLVFIYSYKPTSTHLKPGVQSFGHCVVCQVVFGIPANYVCWLTWLIIFDTSNVVFKIFR